MKYRTTKTRPFGLATENLYRDVDDDSTPAEKALWHFLAYADDIQHGDTPDLDAVLAKVEFALSTEGGK